MKIKKVILDLDDTCNDFTMTALKHVNCKVEGPRDFSVYNPKWRFNIIKAVNILHPTNVFTKRYFWDLFDEYFWSSLPKSKEFDVILHIALNIASKEGVLILTSPICGPDISERATEKCLIGKHRWIKSHFPPFLHQSFSMSPAKHFCATPDAVLIDDCDENVEDFQKAGGEAVLMPRPWNKAHSQDPIPYITTKLMDIIR